MQDNPILTTSPIHLSLKGWENVLFELGSERVKVLALSCRPSRLISLATTLRERGEESVVGMKRDTDVESG